MERILNSGTDSSAALERLLSNATTTDLQRSQAHSLSLPEVQEMALMMGQMKANYGNQSIPPGWADLTRSHWTDIAERHGMPVLREAVAKHLDTSDFLPTRAAINQQVRIILERKESARQLSSARQFQDELASWKEQWKRERAEAKAGASAEIETEVQAA